MAPAAASAFDFVKHSRLQRLFLCLNDKDSSAAATIYAWAMPIIITISVLVALLHSADPPIIERETGTFMMAAFEVCFLFEYMVNLVAAPKRLEFIRNPFTIIDILAAMPLAIRLSASYWQSDLGTHTDEIMSGLLPGLRLLKTLRHFKGFFLIINAFRRAAEALPVLLFTLAAIVLTFSFLIFMVEPRTNIPSLTRSIWLVVITMTTVGYGDLTTESTAGDLLSLVVIILGLLYTAIPIGIVGNAFAEVWADRDTLLVKRELKIALRQWGYSVHDVLCIFREFDADGSGELDFTEFRAMMSRLRIGLQYRRVVQLFKTLTQDNGVITDRQFVMQLFPESYQEIFNPKGVQRTGSFGRRTSMLGQEISNAARRVQSAVDAMAMSVAFAGRLKFMSRDDHREEGQTSGQEDSGPEDDQESVEGAEAGSDNGADPAAKAANGERRVPRTFRRLAKRRARSLP